MYGNLQMFPKPMADPAMAIITANLLPNVSRVFSILLQNKIRDEDYGYRYGSEIFH